MGESVVMESDSGEMIGEVIRQGFLCPFCMEDLGDASHLQAHVERDHPESASSVYALDHLKGFFDKAKQKIMPPFSNFDLPNLASSSSATSLEGRPTEKEPPKRRKSPRRLVEAPQEMGGKRSHTDFFLKCRTPCINEAAMQTNNLIIRLDKLINQCPKDVTKRKEFERETVPWVADGDSNTCRVCGSRFTLARRRHHCRLCGKLMCHQCSQFLPFITARRLTSSPMAAQLMEEMCRVERKGVTLLDGLAGTTGSSPSKSTTSSSMGHALRYAVSADSLLSMRKTSEKLLSSTLALMKGDGSEVSLASLLQQDEHEHLRICAVCKNLLDIRDEQMEQTNAPPMVVELYNRLCLLMREAKKLTSSYAHMHDSLSKGESMFTLDSAKQLRNKLLLIQKDMDSLSAKIEVFGQSEESVKKASPRERILQRNIRYVALRTLRESVSQMHALPSDEEYERLQEKRRAEIARQTELERERNAFVVKPSSSNTSLKDLVGTRSSEESPRRMQLKESSSFSGTIETGFTSGEDGWTPSTNYAHHNPFAEEEHNIDPLQEQILIIKGYLKQAAEDGRLEEVSMLEGNLRDLEEALQLKVQPLER